MGAQWNLLRSRELIIIEKILAYRVILSVAELTCEWVKSKIFRFYKNLKIYNFFFNVFVKRKLPVLKFALQKFLFKLILFRNYRFVYF